MNLDLTCLRDVRDLADDIRRHADALMERSSAMPEDRLADVMAVMSDSALAMEGIRDGLDAFLNEHKERRPCASRRN